MQEEYQEKYATISIRGLEGKVENELFPAAFSICDRIEEEGKKEFERRLNRFHACSVKRYSIPYSIRIKWFVESCN